MRCKHDHRCGKVFPEVGSGQYCCCNSHVIVAKVVGSGATALFYGGYTAEASPFLKQLRAAGWKGTFVGGDGVTDNKMLSAHGEGDVWGHILTRTGRPGHSFE